MIKHLLAPLLAAAAAFSLPQDAPAPSFTVSNKIAASTSADTARRQFLDGKLYSGVNINDGGVAPTDPAKAAQYTASLGVNLVRVFRDDRGVSDGWISLAGELAFLDQLKANGIRTCVNAESSIGELYPGGNDAFGIDLFNQVPAAETLFLTSLERRRAVLAHSSVLVINMANERAHRTTPEKAIAFFAKWAPWFRKVNPKALLTFLPDAWALAEHPSHWAPVMALCDVISANWYGGGEDFGPNGGGTWIGEGWVLWKLRLFVSRVREISGVKKPVLIQEMGSFSVNKHYGANEMFFRVMATLEGWSVCVFALVTNQAGWDGTSADKYAAVTDPLRMNMILFGSYLLKNRAGLKLDHWDGTLGQWGPNFRASGEKVEITQDYAVVGSYVWSWGAIRRLWLVKLISLISPLNGSAPAFAY
jgi:hypothetical protein